MLKYLLILLCLCLCLQGCNNPSTNNQSTLRVSSSTEPGTLDPRLSRSLTNITYIKMFYEGLMSQGKDGELIPAAAEDVTVTNHGKTYTFSLKECSWSNGDPVTAKDFEMSWKSMLDPEFPAPLAYQLYMIKGAKDAKESGGSLEDVKITAIDDRTLVVELIEPTPYFLEMTATVTFCPVHPDWAKDTTAPLIVNGPFQLHRWDKGSEVQAVKNPKYRDAKNVQIEKVTVMILEENTALQMFKAGELDWAGSPLSAIPTDAKMALKEHNQLNVAPAAGTHWFCYNTELYPFDNVKMRKALSLAINRNEIVEHIIQGGQQPATGVVPISYGLQTYPYFEDNAAKQAGDLFQEALAEMGISKEKLPTITLSYISTELNNKIAQAVEQQWKEAFGLDVQLENCESKIYFEKLTSREFQIGIGSFYGDYRDPYNFLEVFKSKENRTNGSSWENQQFTELLNLSARVSDKQNRMNILRRAEKILVSEMPVAPLYYNCYNYVKNERVDDVYFSDLGYLDFKFAVLK